MTDEVLPGEKSCGVSICDFPVQCTSEQRINKIRTPGFETSSIAFVKAFPRGEGAELARRMRCHRAKSRAGYGFSAILLDVQANNKSTKFVHLGLKAFLARGPLTGMPPASRAYAPPCPGRLFSSRSRTHWSLPPRGRCRACEADEVSPGKKTAGYGFSAVLLDVSANKKQRSPYNRSLNFATLFLFCLR